MRLSRMTELPKAERSRLHRDVYLLHLEMFNRKGYSTTLKRVIRRLNQFNVLNGIS